MNEELPGFNLYAELEVSPYASTDTIEAAWRSLQKRNHPDMASDPEAAEAKAKRLNQAHYWLTDPVRRRDYDEAGGDRPGQRRARPRAKSAPEEPAADADPVRKTRSARAGTEPRTERAVEPTAITTNWSLPRMLYRCGYLTPDEIRGLAAAAAQRPIDWWGVSHDAVRRAKQSFIASSGSLAEANHRRGWFTRVGPRVAWPAYTSVKQLANAGPAWNSSDRAANVAHEAAVALFWKDWLTPTEFAGYFLPWHAAIGLDSDPTGQVFASPQGLAGGHGGRKAKGRSILESILNDLWKASLDSVTGTKRRRR
jgi:hypothetical protein